MKTVLKISLALLVSLGVTSCETIIDYDLPREDQKLTMDTKLLAGDSISVFIGTTMYPLDNGSPGAPTNATVKIYENGQYLADLTLRDNFFQGGVPYVYSSSEYIKSGNSYKIEASLEGYETIHAEQFVREAVRIDETYFDASRQELTFTFNDPETKDDHYLITIYEAEYSYRYSYSTRDIAVDFFDQDYFVDPFGEEEKYGQRGYMSDQYFNGQKKTVTLQIPSFYDDEFDDYRYYVELWRITADLYEHERTKSAAFLSENPFAEPVQIYSNVANGYGIVGGAAIDREQFYP